MKVKEIQEVEVKVDIDMIYVTYQRFECFPMCDFFANF
jgi:hypothetical protein